MDNKSQLALGILNRFICGFNKSSTFSPKSYAKANRALKEVLDSSDKWDTRVLTQKEAKAMNTTKGDSYLAGDFVATNIVPISQSYADSQRRNKVTVEPRVLNVHLRKDDIKTKHLSKLSFL